MNKINVHALEQGNPDKLLRDLIEIDLRNFKATRGRFLINNPNSKSERKLFA